MKLKSTYHTTCACGQEIVSEGTIVTCPKCGVILILKWRGDPDEPSRKD